VKRFGKYRRKEKKNMKIQKKIVERYEKYGRKTSLIVRRFG
jgi:rRNA maturation protein Nop10